jgi:fatty-acyl-CoA synthase
VIQDSRIPFARFMGPTVPPVLEPFVPRCGPGESAAPAHDWLAAQAGVAADQTALWDATSGALQATSWATWNADANRTARLLRDGLGLQRGDRLAVLAMNDRAVLDLWFAAGKLGVIFCPLNWRLALEELAAVLIQLEPRALFFGPELAAAARSLVGQLPTMAPVALRRENAGPGEAFFAQRNELSPAGLGAVEATTADPWALCGTGGSTGTPKAAILSFGAIAANARNTAAAWGLKRSDVALLNAPLFHTGGLNVLTAPLVEVGGASIIARSFEPDQVFDLVEARRMTVMFGVPTMFIALQRHARWAGTDFSSLRFVISGGAPCPPEVFQRFWDKGVDFKTGYGLTEAGPNNFWLPAEHVRRKPGSVGFPLPHVEARIVTEGGQDAEPGEVGELFLRGPHLASGYWRRPEETRAAFAGGWLRTADLARRDEEGFYFIVGRKKEMLISGGENIYPSEVESVLSGHPAVAEVAVIGVRDPKWGEVPRALVVLLAGAAEDPAALRAHCEARLARYKVPRSFLFVASLPRTAAGKVDRRELARTHGG